MGNYGKESNERLENMTEPIKITKECPNCGATLRFDFTKIVDMAIMKTIEAVKKKVSSR